MGRPDVRGGDAHCIAQRELIAPSVRQVGIEELLERRSGPRERVNPVGNAMYRVAGEHAVRDLPMLHRNPVDIPRAPQSQLGKIERLLNTAGLQYGPPAIA